MPMYVYHCDGCAHDAEEFQHIADPPIALCPKCGSNGFHRVPTLAHTDMKEFQTPIEMFSIACDDDNQIRTLQKRCPGVEISSDPNDPNYGIPVARTRKQKTDLLKAAGYVEKK